MIGKTSVYLLIAGLLTVTSYSQVTTGTISGIAMDSTGAVVPDVEVAILNEETGISRTVQTNAEGRYSAPSLNPGRYRVTVSLTGFQTQVRSGIQLTVGREAVVNFDLAVGQVAESVEVTGEAPLVQTTESTISYLVGDRTISDLPINGRDISQLILLNPGVTLSHNNAVGADKGFGKRISISGMRGEDNSYLLDGSYINDYYRHIPAGPSGALTGVETVREFQVLTDSFSASYGRALGGVFNAVTKSGTNEWHGSVYEFLRNSALDARNFFDRKENPSDPRLPPFRRNQFGATLEGPIFRDKAFFFVAYEGLRESLTRTSIARVPDLDARRGVLPQALGGTVPISPKSAPYLAHYPLPSPQGRRFSDGTAQYIFQGRQPTWEDFGQARVDHQLSENDSFFGRYTASNSQRDSVIDFPDRIRMGTLATRLLTLSNTHIISARALNTARFAFNRVIPGVNHSLPQIPEMVSVAGQPFVPEITPGGGVSQMGGEEQPGAHFTTNRFAFHDDVNLTLQNHSLQFGGMVERLQFNMFRPFRPYGGWRFDDLANFLRGIPNRYRGTPLQFGVFERGFRQTFLAAYLHDNWRVTPGLTLNLGLRWEPYTVPSEVNGRIANLRRLQDLAPTIGEPYWNNKSWANFGPRLGFAWSPSNSGKVSVRGGAGLFFVPVDTSIYWVQAVDAKPFSSVILIANPDPAFFPNALALIASTQTGAAGGNVTALPFDNLESPHALQYNLSVQYQLGSSDVLTLGYTGRRGMNLTSYGDQNLPVMSYNGRSLELAADGVRTNPIYGGIYYITSEANSWYNGLTVALQRRFAAGLMAQLSYTYSKATAEADGSDTGNHVGGGGTGEQKNPRDLNANKGLSSYHFQNVLSLNYSYDVPLGRNLTGLARHALSGWQIAGIVSLQDGQPFTLGAALSRQLTAFLFNNRSPNQAPGFDYDQIVQGGPDQYFNPAAYSSPAPFELGNVGRNTLIGPGFVKMDFGLTKHTLLTERWNLQFRAQVFNMLNRTNFSAPASNLFSGTGVPVASAGLITGTVATSRQIQFGMKLSF